VGSDGKVPVPKPMRFQFSSGTGTVEPATVRNRFGIGTVEPAKVWNWFRTGPKDTPLMMGENREVSKKLVAVRRKG